MAGCGVSLRRDSCSDSAKPLELPDGHRMANLNPGIDDADPVLEERGKVTARQIAVLVDRRGEDRSIVFKVPCRVVGPTAQKKEIRYGLLLMITSFPPSPRPAFAGWSSPLRASLPQQNQVRPNPPRQPGRHTLY